MRRFDACITIGPHHLATEGLEGPPGTAIAAARSVVPRMDGAAWVDVAAEAYQLESQGWVGLRRRGCSDTPNTRAWRETQQTAEAVTLRAMIAADAPSLLAAPGR